MIARQQAIAARFWSKVDKSGGKNACWPWMAGSFPPGYGVFWYDKDRPCGADNGASVLVDTQVLEIRSLYTEGNTTWKKLALEYGVTKCQIGNIIHRKSWKHI